MQSLLFYVPFLVPVIVAQYAKRQQWAQYTTYGLLILVNLGLLGIAGLALLNELAKAFMPSLVQPQALTTNWLGVAAATLVTSILAFLPLIPLVRRWVARLLPIDPDSMVHMTALTFAIYQIGLSLAQLALIGNLENLAEGSLALTIWDVVLTGVPLTLFALLGVGLLIRRDWRETAKRLGLRRPTWKQLAAGVGVAALFLALDLMVNLLWQQIDPTSYDQLDRVTRNLFGGLSTVSGAFVLGLSAGISEELLFRGAVLPKLGLLLTTVLFAIGHLQYGLTLATLEVFVIGLVLGLMRRWTNTTICIFVHFAYNTATVLLGMWQP
jgi:membrane protease YdiL (CAAX protease family)